MSRRDPLRRVDVANPRRVSKAGPTRLKIKAPERVCPTGKVLHPTLRAAEVEAERMMELGYVDPGCHVAALECHVCHCWHVGNRRIVFRD